MCDYSGTHLHLLDQQLGTKSATQVVAVAVAMLVGAQLTPTESHV